MNRKIFSLLVLLTLALICWMSAAKISSDKEIHSTITQNTDIAQNTDSTPDIAVIVDGDDPLQVETAETRIISFLIQNGYSPANEEKMRAVKADAAKYQAVSLAMQENYSAVFRLIAGYSLAAVVLADVLEGHAEKNPFDLYTGMASVRLLAVTSSVTKMGGQTSSKRAVAFGEEEAVLKSIEAAVDEGMKEIRF